MTSKQNENNPNLVMMFLCCVFCEAWACFPIQLVAEIYAKFDVFMKS